MWPMSLNLICACVGLICFASIFAYLSRVDSGCSVVLTGESVRFQGCEVTEEFTRALSSVRALGSCGTLGLE